MSVSTNHEEWKLSENNGHLYLLQTGMIENMILIVNRQYNRYYQQRKQNKVNIYKLNLCVIFSVRASKRRVRYSNNVETAPRRTNTTCLP